MSRLVLRISLSLIFGIPSSMGAVDETPLVPTVRSEIPQSLDFPATPQLPSRTSPKKSDGKIAEELAGLRCGDRIEVVMHLYGPEGGGILGSWTLEGRLGSMSADGFMLTKKVGVCDPTKPNTDRLIQFDDVVSVKPKRRTWVHWLDFH